ncbi:MAG: endonuclease III [Bacilli bacterium]|nr:endonuclease III [Bacilli bacterium]
MDKVTLIMDVLDEMFPDAKCELNHSNPFELLIAVILSSQTTDKSVNRVTETLFKKFNKPEDYAKASIVEIEEEIKTLGLYHNKAKNIKQTAEILLKDYGGNVPSTREDLLKLPGVGRKTANVILSVAYGQAAFAVDTHVERVSKRLQIAEETDSVLEVERKLNTFFPEHMWHKLHHQMIFFGRYHCFARNPKCHECKLTSICRYYKTNYKNKEK